MKNKIQREQTVGSFFTVMLRASPLLASILLVTMSSEAYAHRGYDEHDPCRIKIGSEWIHFSAYTPVFTENKSYCRSIPKVGLTDLVFDYEGKEIRDVAIEFEVTKEPEGTRIFYKEPSTSKTGIVEADIDFTKFGAGNYQAHVTLHENGEKVDTHIPFSVGLEGDESFDRIKKVLMTILVSAAIAYGCFRFARGKA